eukprot:5458823-Pleurochrysis_carterae.AAC.4
MCTSRLHNKRSAHIEGARVGECGGGERDADERAHPTHGCGGGHGGRGTPRGRHRAERRQLSKIAI